MILLPLLLVILFATNAVASPPCHPAGSGGPVQAPVFVRNLSGQTSWYASPLIADLDGNGSNEVIAAYYDIFVFDSAGTLLDRTTDQQGRVYAPHVVTDLDGDGQLEVLVQTFDHGLDVFTVPGSGTNCLPWSTARGGPWRMGQQNGPWMLTDLFADGFDFGHTSMWSQTVP